MSKKKHKKYGPVIIEKPTSKKGITKLEFDSKLRAQLSNSIDDYEDNMIRIRDPRSDMHSIGNWVFEKNILIDHILMTFDYYLKSQKEV